MICPNCNAEIENGSTICSACGAELEQPNVEKTADTATAETEKTEKPSGSAGKFYLNKKFLAVAAAVVAALVVLLAIIIGAASKGDAFDLLEDDIYTAYSSDDDKTTVLFNNKIVATLDGNVSVGQTSMDGKSAVLASVNYEKLEITLYYLKGKKVTKVSDSVGEVLAISANSTAAVLKVDGDVVYATLKNGKTTTVLTSDAYSDLGDFTLSPDGKTLVYSYTEKSTGDSDEKKESLHLWKNGKDQKLGSGYSPVAVADSAKYIWAKKDGSFYLMNKKGDADKITENVVGTYYFNKDLSEVVFYVHKDLAIETYFYKKGMDAKQKLRSDSLVLVTPDDVCESRVVGGSGIATVYGVDHLRNQLYCSPESLLISKTYNVYYIAKNENKSTKVASSCSYLKLTDDGETLFFIKDDELRKVAFGKTESKEIARDVVDAFVSDDGKKIAYINEDEALCNAKGKKIADDVVSAMITHDGVLIYVNDEGDYFTSKNFKSGKAVENGDAIHSVTIGRCTTAVETDKDDEGCKISVVKSGFNFKKKIDTKLYSDFSNN